MSTKSMKNRRRSRELALQILYAIEISGQDPEPCIEQILSHEGAEEDEGKYARLLVEGTLSECSTIDAKLSECSHHWKLERMPTVDRNLLRMAVYELLHEDMAPRKVVLNEAVEIAKRFGDQKSSAFVNAILDKIKPTEPS